VLGAEWGATGAAIAVLASSVAFCLYWTFLFLRIRREPTPSGATFEAALS
jgi:Na+-driven multidrug efflux pump